MLFKLDQWIHRVILATACTLLALAVSMTFYQVVTRFILGEPSALSEVLARAFVIWSVFLSLSVLIRQGKLIAIEVGFKAIPSAYRAYIQYWVLLWITLFILILLWYGIEITYRVSGQRVALLGISMSWLYLSIPVGAGLSLIAIFFRFLEFSTTHPPLEKEFHAKDRHNLKIADNDERYKNE